MNITLNIKITRSMIDCSHNNVTCLNHYELIRKYECNICNNVMMCLCDKEYGEKFLPHQLKQGCRLESQERVLVTLGFQKDICNECKGKKPVAAPIHSGFGHTSKITRYYWREIMFETNRKFYNKYPNLKAISHEDDKISREDRKLIKKEVIKNIKEGHNKNPKYEYNEPSQEEILKLTNTEVIQVNAKHVSIIDEKKVGIENRDGQLLTAEDFAIQHLSQHYSCIKTESIPFHVIFGVYMWPVIQDHRDPYCRTVAFGNKDKPQDESKTASGMLYMDLPSDFGSEGYFNRREEEIRKHINDLTSLKWLFNYWLSHSKNLRQYLWAFKKNDINTAKQIINLMSDTNIKSILLYLSKNYWSNFCGWPDLIAFNKEELVFIEVKSSNDKLSEDQKNWLLGNQKCMNFKAKIFKIAKPTH